MLMKLTICRLRPGRELEVSPDQKDHEQRQRGRGAGQDGGDRPPRQHRHLRPQQRVHDRAEPRDLDLDAGIALHQSDIAERIGGGLGEVGVVALHRLLQRKGASDDDEGERGEGDAEHDQRQCQAPVQPERGGNRNMMKTNAAKCSRKNEIHSHHSVSVPVSITFICRPECSPE